MKNEILNFGKENFIDKISLIFISIFLIILLTGSSILNTSVVLMNIFFLIHIFKNKKFQVFNNDMFFFLFALWIFLIINTLLNNNITENYERGFGFIRFILLIFFVSYFLSYKNFMFKKIILNIWAIIFIIVSLDLVFEFFFGYNTLGFSSSYRGRLSGFMGDELKIGHWYLCFSLIILSNFINNNKKFYFLLLLSILISFFIGERANFIRLFLAIFFLILITKPLLYKIITILLIATISIVIVETKVLESTDETKKRYVDQLYYIATQDSFKKFHNSNNYTPMYFNAYSVFLENKILGVGLGSYYKESHKKFRKIKEINGFDLITNGHLHQYPLGPPEINGYKIIANTHPHQFHFEILATLGLPGYIFIFSLMLYFFYKSLRFYKIRKEPINLTSFLFLFVLTIPLLPTGSFFTTYGATIFWLNFSLMNIRNFKNINY